MWRLNDDYDHLIIEQMSSVWHGNKNGIDFNFKTLAAGQTTLTFVLRKYTDTSIIKQFIVQINGKYFFFRLIKVSLAGKKYYFKKIK